MGSLLALCLLICFPVFLLLSGSVTGEYEMAQRLLPDGGRKAPRGGDL